MGLRRALSAFLSAPAVRLLERELRELVDDALARRPFAQAAEVEALRAELEALKSAGSTGAAEEITALQAEVQSLKKRLSMAMGAIQASTAQLMQAQKLAEEAHGVALQANQRANSALAAAEAAVDGVAGVEERLTAEPASPPAEPAPEPKDEALCRVPGCRERHRARGFCGRHYQQFRRSTLEGFVGPDGVVPLEGETLQLDPALAGKHVVREGGRLLVDGAPLTE